MSLLNIKNLKVKRGCKINVWRVNVNDTPFSRLDLFKKLKTFRDFCDLWHIDADELLDISEKLCITDNHLFDYSTCGGNSDYALHLSDNDLYTEKWVSNPFGGHMETKYYPLSIKANEYISLSFNKIAEYIVKMRFPYFFDYPFGENKERFSDEVIARLPANINTMLNDIDISVTDKLTIDDLIKIYTIPNYAKTKETKTLFEIYGDGNIFLTLTKEPSSSLYIKIDDLYNKDWKAIEERKVFSIPMGNGKFFEGKQKDAPYFSHKLVNELKKYFSGT